MAEDDWEDEKVKLLPPPQNPVFGAWRSDAMKPFVDGGLAGLFKMLISYSNILLWDPLLIMNASYSTIFKTAQGIPSQLLISSAFSSMQLGTYETLMRRVEVANRGSPLTLYQQVCCGLTTGAVVACISTPPKLAAARMASQATPTDVLLSLYRRVGENGVLSLWKGGSIFSNVLVAWNMGMLVSYNQSFNYFRESLGLHEDAAVIGAGSVSTFFASGCSKPFMFVHEVKYFRASDGSMRFSKLSALDITLRALKNGGPLVFFRGFSNYWWKTAPSIMLTWLALEDIRRYRKKKTGSSSSLEDDK